MEMENAHMMDYEHNRNEARVDGWKKFENERTDLVKSLRFIPVRNDFAKWLKTHQKCVNPKLSRKQSAELTECFNVIDADSSGSLEVQELMTAFEFMGIDVGAEGIKNMVASMDQDNSGCVDYDEFVEIMTGTIKKSLQYDTWEDDPLADILGNFPTLAAAFCRRKRLDAIDTKDSLQRKLGLEQVIKEGKNIEKKNNALARKKLREKPKEKQKTTLSQMAKSLRLAIRLTDELAD
eukprot:6404186-Pyramimonas_sp.AAC.1